MATHDARGQARFPELAFQGPTRPTSPAWRPVRVRLACSACPGERPAVDSTPCVQCAGDGREWPAGSPLAALYADHGCQRCGGSGHEELSGTHNGTRCPRCGGRMRWYAE